MTVLHRRDQSRSRAGDPQLQADRSDLAALSRVLRDGRFDAVFDVAYDWQKGTTADQVEAAARSCGDRLQRYVFMSSIAAYGPGLDHRESDAARARTTVRTRTRSTRPPSERALFRMHAESGFPGHHVPAAVRARTAAAVLSRAVLLGSAARRPSDHPARRRRRADAVGVRLGSGEACVRAIEVPEAAGEAFNIAHVERLTQRSFVEALARVAGVDATFAPMPRAAIHGGRRQRRSRATSTSASSSISRRTRR